MTAQLGVSVYVNLAQVCSGRDKHIHRFMEGVLQKLQKEDGLLLCWVKGNLETSVEFQYHERKETKEQDDQINQCLYAVRSAIQQQPWWKTRSKVPDVHCNVCLHASTNSVKFSFREGMLGDVKTMDCFGYGRGR